MLFMMISKLLQLENEINLYITLLIHNLKML